MATGYVVLDVEKPEQTLVNLTKNFQGRVGDSRAYCKLWFKSNGKPLDLSKKSVGFAGVDPDGNAWNAVGWADTDQAGDDIQVGRVTYYFPSGMFQVEGDWDETSTYFYIDDQKQDQHISTISVLLRVLPNMVEMGIDAEPFKTDLDKAEAEFKDYLATKKKDIEKDLEEVNSDALKMQIESLKNIIANYTQMIEDKQVPTENDMHNYVDALMGASETSHDLDDLKSGQQTYLVQANTANTPNTESGLLRVFGNSDDWCAQMFIDQDANLWIRYYTNGKGWTKWREQVAWS